MYSTIVFDCDGVIFDSNRIKTFAFKEAAAPYGEEAAFALVQHHVANGGVSRYRKFEYFLAEIVPALTSVGTNITDAGQSTLGLAALLETYSELVYQGLRKCSIAEGLGTLRASMPQARWMVASGGDQVELREVFAERGIADWFNGGIFGSPASKHEIVANECRRGCVRHPAVYFGDSRIDHEVAIANHLDFVFVSGWTEMPEWQVYAKARNLKVVDSITDFFQTTYSG